jgi:hypothetical protein
MRALSFVQVLATLRPLVLAASQAMPRRRWAVVASILAAALPFSAAAQAQVSDAERAAARQLFKEGDELQRGGKFVEALDKFRRAETVYSAPTNVLRIAECQAALGQLVESAESYRTALRMPMPPGSPQAFQAAVDQAKGELAQVEPRVPKLIVQLAPGTTADAQLQIDGQSVSTALVGEPIPLDPGTHRVRVFAQGFASSEQDAVLKEHETTTVVATLKPLAHAALPPPALPVLLAPSPPPPTPVPPPAAGATATPAGVPPPYGTPPPPPPITDKDIAIARKPSRVGLLFGAHVGWELGGGKLPMGGSTTVDTNLVASGGVAYALEGGLRFARQWYLGLNLEHADLGHGDLSALHASDANSSTTLLGAVIGYIGNPDRASFYGELGAATRWFSFTETISDLQTTTNYSSGELTLGAGLWVPAGSAVRLLPKLTVGVGSFDFEGSSEGHSFVMLGLAGYYNMDF